MNIHFCLPHVHVDTQQKHKCTCTLQVTITNATEKLLSPAKKTWHAASSSPSTELALANLHKHSLRTQQKGAVCGFLGGLLTYIH